MPKRSNLVAGFTLIELLIVIAIIAILATIGFASYIVVQQNARDAKRRSELDSIAKALEIRYQISSGSTCEGQGSVSNGGTYCPLVATWFASNVVPTDTVRTARFCITSSVNNPPPALPASNPTPAQWSNGTATCPVGAGLTGAGNTDFTTIAAGGPPLNTTVWRVCTILEKDNSVICFNSKQ